MDHPNNKNRRAIACVSGPEWMGHFSAILVILNGWNGPWICLHDLTTWNLNWPFPFSFYLFFKQFPSSSQEVLLLHCVLITVSVLLRIKHWLYCMESLFKNVEVCVCGEVISSNIPSSSSLAPKSNYSSGKRNNTAISAWLRTLGLVSCFRLMLSVPFGDSE